MDKYSSEKKLVQDLSVDKTIQELKNKGLIYSGILPSPKSKVEDYKIEYEDLLYLIVEGQSVLDLTKKVHKHICKGWKTVGGVQLGEDSTRGGPNNKKFYFLQSGCMYIKL